MNEMSKLIRKLVTYMITSIAVSACTNPLMSFSNGQWEFTSLAKPAAKAAGAEAVDCGFHLMQTESGPGSALYGIECVRRAISHNSPFKYGVVDVEGSDLVTHVLVRSPNGKYEDVELRQATDSSESSLSVEHCESITVDKI